ncbi:U3 small nucleolar RNA-associated protein 13, partial [Phenoliferia sp. Uapishka_3]
MATARPKLKTSFKVARTYEPIHTAGKLVLSADGQWLVSTLNEQALVSEVATGNRIQLLKGDSSAVTTLAITPNPASPNQGGYLLTCCRSLALHIYSLPDLELHKTIPKAHESPIITSASDPTGTLFATGAADGLVKVWDAKAGHCTHVFKGHGGVISALTFDIGAGGRARLVSGADDCKIRVWDLRTRECLHVLDGHVSVVRGLQVTPDGKTLVSGGRDKVFNVWDLERGVMRRTVPVFETLEAVGVVEIEAQPSGKGKGKEEGENEKKWAVWTGGDKGQIKLWDLATGDAIAQGDDVPDATGKTHEILDVLHTPLTSSLTAVYVDQNIITRSLPTLSVTRQIIGYNDEVIDTAFLTSSPPSDSLPSTSTESHLAVATNSDLIRVYDLARFNTSLLSGHTDVVLCLSSSSDRQLLVSGSKDKTARIWVPLPSSSPETSATWSCIATATGHVESIGALAVSRKDRSFLITASQDRTAKIWDLASLLSPAPSSSSADPAAPLRSLSTLKIHDKDINSLDIAPNDKLLASGSQDRTARLFRIVYSPKSKSGEATASLEPVGTFKGHKRGVWSVKFSPVDQVLATASGDRTVKLWSLGDFSCLKTFEGHSNSVLRVDFLTRGMQLVSCASDGLVKVWNVKDEEVASTLDNHEEKVCFPSSSHRVLGLTLFLMKIWALAVRNDEKEIVSGGADSVITFWEDVTETEELERIAEHEDKVLKEQDFENYLSTKDYSNAILLALSMDQPRRLLKLFTEVRLSTSDDRDSLTGSTNVDAVLKSLRGADLRQLLSYVKDWNTVARTAEVAQGVLHAILRFHSAEEVLEALEAKSEAPKDEEMEVDSEDEDEDLKKRRKEKKKAPREVKAAEVLGALVPYTERHLNRADKMVRESFIVEHLLSMMDSFDDEQ